MQVLTNFPNCGHCPLILHYYFENCVEITLPSQTEYSWHRGKYNRINSFLLDGDWDFEFHDMPLDDMLLKLKSIVAPLITQHVLTSHNCPRQPHQRPPNSLKSNRRNAWLAYKHSRASYGRHSQQANTALEQFNELNHMLRNYHVTQQILYETSLINKMIGSPKLLHQYIRNKNIGSPEAGQWCTDC